MSNSDELITSVGKNSNDTAALVWSVADDLVGAYKPHEYGLVILPMTVIKRFHDCLLPTHQAVLDTYKKVEKLAVKDGFLRKASGYQFYNTSPFTFKTLKILFVDSLNHTTKKPEHISQAVTSSI